jgi:hypothetical protein
MRSLLFAASIIRQRVEFGKQANANMFASWFEFGFDAIV